MKNCCKLKRLVLDFKNQRGFATLEITCVLMIISVLVTVAVPKMARMIDVVRLDYEVKKFCSEFDFAHSLGKQAEFNTTIFSDKVYVDDNSRRVLLRINEKSNTYQILRATTMEAVPIRDKHILSDGIKIKVAKNSTIYFKSDGTVVNDNDRAISESFTFTSRYNEFYVSVDSVGRWRGKREQ